MIIDGMTVCVGPKYSSLLSNSVRIWADTLDSLTIITDGNGLYEPLKSSIPANVQILRTDVFTRFGAHLNKGAALNEAYALIDPPDWVLHFDSDIIPPSDWRSRAEPRLRKGRIHGVFREDEQGKCIDEAPLYPYGYFHLWHSSDPNTWNWPIFDIKHPHAGWYDTEFAELWRWPLRRDLCFRVTHQGEPRNNWFGRDHPEIQRFHKIGLFRARLQTREGMNILKLPEPFIKLNLESDNGEWVQSVLRVCRKYSPFEVRVAHRLFQPRAEPYSYTNADKLGYIPIDETSTPVSVLRNMLEEEKLTWDSTLKSVK